MQIYGLMSPTCYNVSTWVIFDPTCLCVTIKTNHKGSCETKWLHTLVFLTKGALNPKRNLPGLIRVATVVIKLDQLQNILAQHHNFAT